MTGGIALIFRALNNQEGSAFYNLMSFNYNYINMLAIPTTKTRPADSWHSYTLYSYIFPLVRLLSPASLFFQLYLFIVLPSFI